MVASIIVGRGTNRTVIVVPRDKDTRRSLGGKIKGALFATNQAYTAAKARGLRAIAANAPVFA